MCAALEELEAGRIRRLIINLPPRHGKTQLARPRCSPLGLAVKTPKSRSFSAPTEQILAGHGRAVRDIMLMPPYNQVFPGTNLKTDSKASDRLETTEGGTSLCRAWRDHHRSRRRLPGDRRSDQGPHGGRQPDDPGHPLDLVYPGYRQSADGRDRPDHADPDPLAPGRPDRSPDRPHNSYTTRRRPPSGTSSTCRLWLSTTARTRCAARWGTPCGPDVLGRAISKPCSAATCGDFRHYTKGGQARLAGRSSASTGSIPTGPTTCPLRSGATPLPTTPSA